jgi:hypothetical protein
VELSVKKERTNLMKNLSLLLWFLMIIPFTGKSQIYFQPESQYAQLTNAIRSTQLKIESDSVDYQQQKDELKKQLLPAKLSFDSVRKVVFTFELADKFKTPAKSKIKKGTAVGVVADHDSKQLLGTYEGQEFKLPKEVLTSADQGKIEKHFTNSEEIEDSYRQLVREDVQLAVAWEGKKKSHLSAIDSMRIERDDYIAQRLADKKRLRTLVDKYGEKAAEFIAKGFVVRGMTTEQVREAWGGPRKINRSQINELVLEYWTYIGYTSEQILYFQDGRLYNVKGT